MYIYIYRERERERESFGSSNCIQFVPGGNRERSRVSNGRSNSGHHGGRPGGMALQIVLGGHHGSCAGSVLTSKGNLRPVPSTKPRGFSTWHPFGSIALSCVSILGRQVACPLEPGAALGGMTTLRSSSMSTALWAARCLEAQHYTQIPTSATP